MTPDLPAVLIFNPNAGQKLGLATNAAGPDEVQRALREAGIAFEPRPTEYAGHATALARAAVAEGRRLVIAAGGDGTVGEVAQALACTDAVLGVMPLGSVMNVARTLCIPRDLSAAARLIAGGEILAMDLGRVRGTYFLEAAGVGLAAGLFGYFEQLDARGLRLRTLQGLMRFVHDLGTPRLRIVTDGTTRQVRAPMVTVANSPFVGAAYALAPDACIDDGLLDVVIYRGLGVLRILAHLIAVFGGRRLPQPPGVITLRARSVEVSLVSRRRRPLPAHGDGTTIGTTPAHFEVVPGALRVLIGQPDAGTPCAWRPTTAA
jgi:YegS/Rv2252/BmrU family lipid kinase